MKADQKLDTKLGRREVHNPLRQDDHDNKIRSLVVGANLCCGPSSAIEPTPYTRAREQDTPLCR
jgi:hypothetical protein